MNSEIYDYLYYFIIGGLFFSLLRFFSKQNNIIMSSIVASMPILFVSGIYFICIYNYNSNELV